jgi:hypothetical protein
MGTPLMVVKDLSAVFMDFRRCYGRIKKAGSEEPANYEPGSWNRSPRNQPQSKLH